MEAELNLRRAVARLLPVDEDTRPGSAFAITSTRALTAFHCVGRREGAVVELAFEGGLKVSARTLCGDEDGDLALLELDDELPADFDPLLWVEANSAMDGIRIVVEGFGVEGPPGSTPHALTGSVVRADTTLFDKAPALQLNSPQLIAGENAHQFSGGPVLVDIVGDGGTPRYAAVGVVRWQRPRQDAPEKATGGGFYATPISHALSRWPQYASVLAARRAMYLDRRPEAQDWQEKLQGLLGISLLPDGGLPFVEAVSMYDAGVSKSRYAREHDAPYVTRRVDQRLDQAFASEPFILLVGGSKAGKTRTAFELIQRNCKGSRIIVPTGDPSAPTDIAALGVPVESEPTVLWLDDLDRYLTPHGLDVKVLDYFARHHPRVTVVATMRSKRRQDLRNAEGDAGRAARMVLDRAHDIQLQGDLSQEERKEAQRLYPNEDFSARGIGEQLVAAPLLEEKYDDALDTHPEGWALVQATIDWRRVGLAQPLPEPFLRELFELYLTRARPDIEPTESTWEHAREWALQPVAGSIALVHSSQANGTRLYSPFDYIVAYADGQGDAETVEIPQFAWDHAIEQLSPEDVMTVGFVALTRQERDIAKRALLRARGPDASRETKAWATLTAGDLEAEGGNFEDARALLEEAVASGVVDVVPVAQSDLGVLLRQLGELPRARELIEAALSSGDPSVVPVAQINLAAVLASEGELGRTWELLEAAVESSDSYVVSLGQANLGGLLINVGELARAQEMLEAAVNSGNTQALPLAQANLGGLLFKKGELERARELLEAAIESGNAQALPLAQANLGGLLMNIGNAASLVRARELLEATIVETRDPQILPLAQANLGGLLINTGELERARELLEAAIESGSPYVVPQAQTSLAVLLLDQGDLARADELLEAVIESGNPEAVPVAQARLGAVLAGQGQLERGRELLEAAVDSGSPLAVSLARVNLGGVLMNLGELKRARELLEAEVKSGNPQIIPLAQANLGGLLVSAGELVRARELLEAAIESGGSLAVSLAQANLGGLLINLGELDRARELLEAAIESGDPQVLSLTQANLGGLLINAGDPERGRQLLEAAVESHNPRVVPIAQVNLAAVLLRGGELDRAGELLEAAIVSGDPLAVPLAQANLGGLLMNLGELDRARELLEAAVESGDYQVLPLAQANLGGLLMNLGELDRARELLGAAVESGDPQVLPLAQVNLGMLLVNSGELDRARELFEAVVESGDPQVLSVAQINLGVLLMKGDELERAQELLEAAVMSGGSEYAPFASDILGDLLVECDDIQGAIAAYQTAIDSNHPRWRPIAQVDLATLLSAQGDPESARPLLQLAIESGYQDAMDAAQRVLAELDGEPQGEPELP